MSEVESFFSVSLSDRKHDFTLCALFRTVKIYNLIIQCKRSGPCCMHLAAPTPLHHSLPGRGRGYDSRVEILIQINAWICMIDPGASIMKNVGCINHESYLFLPVTSVSPCRPAGCEWLPGCLSEWLVSSVKKHKGECCGCSCSEGHNVNVAWHDAQSHHRSFQMDFWRLVVGTHTGVRKREEGFCWAWQALTRREEIWLSSLQSSGESMIEIVEPRGDAS